MPKLRMEFVDYGEGRGGVEFYLDERPIGSGGYGGEPEDNTRGRDYSWVEKVLQRLAQELGVEVEKVEKAEED